MGTIRYKGGEAAQVHLLRPQHQRVLAGTASTYGREVLGTAVNLEPEPVSKTCIQMENRSSFGTPFSVFRDELNVRCNFLESRTCRHVHCLRSTVNQASLVFNDNSMLHQCRYSGFLEAGQVRRQGFAHRRTLQPFTTWYAELLQRTRRRAAVDGKEACARVSKHTDAPVGRTKVILRETTLALLEK